MTNFTTDAPDVQRKSDQWARVPLWWPVAIEDAVIGTRRIGNRNAVSPYTVLRVAIAIAGHADFETGTAWPSQETIAKLAGVTDRQVRRVITLLKLAGIITAQHRGRESTLYHCAFDRTIIVRPSDELDRTDSVLSNEPLTGQNEDLTGHFADHDRTVCVHRTDQGRTEDRTAGENAHACARDFARWFYEIAVEDGILQPVKDPERWVRGEESAALRLIEIYGDDVCRERAEAFIGGIRNGLVAKAPRLRYLHECFEWREVVSASSRSFFERRI